MDEKIEDISAGTPEPAAPAPGPEPTSAEAAKARAAQFIAEGRYADARKALREAEKLEEEPLKERATKMYNSVRERIPFPKTAKKDTEETPASEAENTSLTPVEKSLATVGSYSKIAAVVGLLPGGLLNFAGIVAVQVSMVWKIAAHFGQKEGKDKIRGSILSLFGSMIPSTIGHGAGAAIAAIPAVIAGSLVYFLVTPILAYAMTQAVGKAYIMHFESGGTLLTFDPKAFAEYFLKEFQKAGGTVKTEAELAPEATASA